jgi:hypothetical protein
MHLLCVVIFEVLIRRQQHFGMPPTPHPSIINELGYVDLELFHWRANCFTPYITV